MNPKSIFSKGALLLALIVVAGSASAATIESGSIAGPMPDDGVNWTQNLWGETQIRSIPQDLVFEIPNVFRPDHFKTVWLKVTYTEEAFSPVSSAPELLPGLDPLLQEDDVVIDLSSPSNQGATFTKAVTGAAVEGGDWVQTAGTAGIYERTVTYYQTWTITPQPCSEDLYLQDMVDTLWDVYGSNQTGIEFGLNEVEIRTVCKPIVPEPATMSLLALGLAGLGARRIVRRRK